MKRGAGSSDVLSPPPAASEAPQQVDFASPEEPVMLAQCSIPDCGQPFNYREGRLIRVCKPRAVDSQSSKDEDSVEHLGLCARCSQLYALEFGREAGMKVKLRHRDLAERPDLNIRPD